MVGLKALHCPTIVYRPIRPSDLEVLEQIHCDLFPIRYEPEFFFNVVNGQDIVSWGAVDCSQPNGKSDELIGFVTARVILAKESEIGDMLSYDSSSTDQRLVYILTLGVVQAYRNHGIASTLIREVIKYASNIPTCQAVYLHVIAYNHPAICFYKKMSFKCVQKLPNFYYIRGQHYDSYLFVYYVNGGRSPCSPLDIVAIVATYVRSLFKSLAARLWKNDEKNITRWPKCKETSCLLMTQNKRILNNESASCHMGCLQLHKVLMTTITRNRLNGSIKELGNFLQPQRDKSFSCISWVGNKISTTSGLNPGRGIVGMRSLSNQKQY